MTEHVVRVQVIKVYDLTVEADSEEKAAQQVEGMQTLEIYEVGSLHNVWVELVECVDAQYWGNADIALGEVS